jgi:hypothetical protein
MARSSLDLFDTPGREVQTGYIADTLIQGHRGRIGELPKDIADTGFELGHCASCLGKRRTR